MFGFILLHNLVGIKSIPCFRLGVEKHIYMKLSHLEKALCITKFSFQWTLENFYEKIVFNISVKHLILLILPP